MEPRDRLVKMEMTFIRYCEKMTKTNPVEIQKHLKGVDYPADKQELMKHAQQQKADKQILSLLDQLPDDEEFDNPAELNKALGEIQ
jgi:hypothetical protein